MRTAPLMALLLVGCMTPADEIVEPVSGRDDLEVRTYHTRIHDGLSDEVVMDIPDGLQSMLMEVRGKSGLYYLTEFNTPGGDLIEGGVYTTRFAREVPGLVDWLYPNSPTLGIEGGEYRLLLRGETSDGGRANEEVEIRLYTKQKSELETCGLHLDFLVDQRAIDANDFELALDRAVIWVNNLYAPMGVRILDYSITQISLPNPKFDVGTTTVMSQIDDVLSQARQQGSARQDSVHVVVVRTIGGSEPSGYAMGLPGPFDADRSNAAVLVSTDAYTDGEGFLDVEGMASTIGHEVGHYLGLYHTSESNGAQHDPIPDTPQCDGGVCSPEFEKNIMSSGGGASRTVLTEGQAFVMKHHPLCVPADFRPQPQTCDLACDAPQTCSLLQGAAMCRTACDPDGPACESGGVCGPDDNGTFVCSF